MAQLSLVVVDPRRHPRTDRYVRAPTVCCRSGPWALTASTATSVLGVDASLSGSFSARAVL